MKINLGYLLTGNYWTKKFIMLSIMSLVISIVRAENYTRVINWLAQLKDFRTFDNQTIQQPTFSLAVHSEQYGLLPLYKEIIPIAAESNVEIVITDMIFSQPANTDKNSLKFITQNDITIKTELTFEKKKPGACVSFLPFRKNAATGAIEKLESFVLKMTLTPKRQYRSANNYASNSVLAIGNFYKLGVANEGMCKIDFNFLKNTIKVNPTSIDPSKLAIFGNGGGMVPEKNSDERPDDLLENPSTFIDNNGNNKFDEDDYLLFYAQMPDEWRFNSSNQSFVHEKNLYTDKTFYFLTTDAGTGKRVSLTPAGGSENKTVVDYDERVFHELEETNLLSSGKVWLGDKMTGFNNTKTFKFDFPNIISSTPLNLKTRIAASTSSGALIKVNINGQSLLNTTIGGIQNGSYPPAFLTTLSSASYLSPTSPIEIIYSFNPNSDPSGTASGFIDWFEVQFRRKISLLDNQLSFRSIESVGSGNVTKFVIENASSNTRVWDVSKLGEIEEMSAVLSDSKLTFVTTTTKLKEFIAFNLNGNFSYPEFISKVENQNLHSLGQPDMLIVTHSDFQAAATELANFHRSTDNISVEVVKIAQVYNEFGSGKPDISAIRDFVRMFYERAGSNASALPKYLLLMGDATFDPKNRSTSAQNFIPTYESYESAEPVISLACDDFFGLLDGNEGGDITNSTQLLDIGVGRLPVATDMEAWDAVNKIKNYKRPVSEVNCNQLSNNASWRNVLTFIADDLDAGGTVFEDQLDELAETTKLKNPVYNLAKIYMDAYKQLSTPAGARFPEVNVAILNRVNSGSLIVNWMGHGGPTNWASERIFNMSDILQLQNREKLPLFITATCDFGNYDALDRSAGEWLVVNGKGGAIASITTVRLVYQSSNYDLNSQALKCIFNQFEGRNPTLGEIIMQTKNGVTTDITNMRKFTLLGDPALTLNYPRYNVFTTQINNRPIAQSKDTLKALNSVTISGEIRDDSNNKLTEFNGYVFPLVYDKIADITTLGNDAPNIRTFKNYKNLLFKGRASVINGSFNFSFIVPKDINYRYGNGRISYYADNSSNIDAHGFTDSIIIGGAADSFLLDNTGPKMNIYMNDEKFVYGGTTSPDPLLFVKLSDESGINMIGNGIGHDIVAILDNNTQAQITLNDYYESELDNFRKGAVKYPFSKLSDGRHTLKVKAWDVQNNSSDDYTEFIVASNAKLALSHVYNYPNPFTTNTRFMFEINRSCDDLNVSIQIYTVSGKLVKSIVTGVSNMGFRVDDIVWDGLDDYGDQIGKGVYVYRLSVRTSDGQSAHKFEKLVLLR